MSMPMKDIIVSIAMLLFGAWFMSLSSELPIRSIENIPGPAFFPGIVAFFIVALSLALLVRGVRGLRDVQAFSQTVTFPRKAVFVIVLFVIMLAVLPYAGFLMAAIPFFAALMVLCENNKPIQVLIGSVCIPVFLYYLFRHAFSILLPAGQWI